MRHDPGSCRPAALIVEDERPGLRRAGVAQSGADGPDQLSGTVGDRGPVVLWAEPLGQAGLVGPVGRRARHLGVSDDVQRAVAARLQHGAAGMGPALVRLWAALAAEAREGRLIRSVQSWEKVSQAAGSPV